MKNKIWLFQLPIVIVTTFAFIILDYGIHGELNSPWLREHAFDNLKAMEGWVTNAKFQLRGQEAPKNKVVIVGVDEASLNMGGRWPWHRDQIAKLIERIFASGAKAIGMDIVFSEADPRISPELKQFLVDNKIVINERAFETDGKLQDQIILNQDKLVLGWTSDGDCQPAYSKPGECVLDLSDPNLNKEYLTQIEARSGALKRHAFQVQVGAEKFKQNQSPLLHAVYPILNHPSFNDVASHSGFFSAQKDKDGYIRRVQSVTFIDKYPLPSLGLQLAATGLGKKLKIEYSEDNKIKFLGFEDGTQIPVSPLGVMDINFRGPAYTFPYVSAITVIEGVDQEMAKTGDPRNMAVILRDGGRSPASSVAVAEPLESIFKDAYVLIGATAVGINDIRAFPFDSHTPGTEGWATVVDNILSNDMLSHGSRGHSTVWILILMTVVALLFAHAAEKLEALPALALFILSFTSFGLFDFRYLFAHERINWITSPFYIEMLAIFVFTIAIKYVMEERNKKFIKGAFAKYVAPAIIDSIMKDPTKLSVGGEKRDLTILFSDIRGFTTFSERMDAKALAKFLNDYLGIMTDIVFDNEGTLDKYIGDAVMAFWGAPLDQAKHSANACKAAIKMQQALAANYERFKTQYGVEVAIGIGINSGAVNVGNMGSERIFEYTVIGDHVNLASRLEGLTKYYGVKIVTTRYTFDDIKKCNEPYPAHRTLDFVKVKGKKQAVELIQVFEGEMKPDGLALFEEGRQLYASQKWDEAIEKFKKANDILRTSPDGQDDPSMMYVERCEEFKKNPPSADWDGSWEMHSK